MIRNLVTALSVASSLLICFGDVKAQDRNLQSHKVLELHFDNKADLKESPRFMYDSSGKNNHGYANANGPTWRANEGMNGAYEFDGKDDVITVLDADNLSPSNTGELTIGCWMKFGATSFEGEGTGGYVNFIGKGTYSSQSDRGQNEYHFRQYPRSSDRPDRISFYGFNREGGLGAGSYVQRKIDPKKWRHIVGVFTPTHVQMWENGVKVDEDPLSGYDIKFTNGTSPLKFGGEYGNDKFHWKGMLDECVAYDVALTQSEIQGIFKDQVQHFMK
ncbi:LamG domain-containing protein [Candidatus Pacearchaeota archaeon]|nr:LamG domain-containing protein [Candidatus Pacearchaeota archaeon]